MEFIADKYSETCFVIFFLKPTVAAALKWKAPTPENVDLNVRQESSRSLYQQTWRCVMAWSAVCVTRATAVGKKKILKTMATQSVLFNLSQTAYNKTWLKMWLSGRFFVSRQNTSLTNPLMLLRFTCNFFLAKSKPWNFYEVSSLTFPTILLSGFIIPQYHSITYE